MIGGGFRNGGSFNSGIAAGQASVARFGAAGAGGARAVAGGRAVVAGAGNSAGDCAGSCGGLETACCEAEGAVVNTGWAYVGEGRGAYSTIQDYNYVGQGCGNFDKQVSMTYYGWRLKKCCICLMFLLLIPALLYLLMTLVGSSHGGTENIPQIQIKTPPPTPAPVLPATTREPFNCNTREAWGPLKVKYCCAKYGKGCTTTPPPTTKPAPPPKPPPPPHPVPVPVPVPAPVPAPPATTSLPFDCNADYLNCYHCLMSRWSVAKRAWCCAHGGRGCPTGPPAPTPPPTTSLPFDCAAGFHNWQAGWSGGKKAWCCSHASKGCPPPPAVTTTCPPLDCNIGFSNWKAGWTPLKKEYCCKHEGKACE